MSRWICAAMLALWALLGLTGASVVLKVKSTLSGCTGPPGRSIRL